MIPRHAAPRLLRLLKGFHTYAYSYPIILPLATRAVKEGDVLLVKLRYTLCGGMKTLRYEVR